MMIPAACAVARIALDTANDAVVLEEARVDNPRAGGAGKVNAGTHRGIAAGSGVGQAPAVHHLHAPNHPANTFAIVSDRAQYAGYECAMAGAIARIIRAGKCVESRAAAVWIQPYMLDARSLMAEPDPGIEHGHHDIARRGQHVPGVGGIDVGVEGVPPLWP